MRAIALDGPAALPRLYVLPAPQPRRDELLVNVRASSVNSIDRALASDGLLATIPHEFPVVLGHDFAGVVERIGGDVTLYREGDEVFGFLAMPKRDARSGTWADYLVVPEDRSVTRKPTTVGFAYAGTLPLAGVAALAAVDAVDPGPGDVVLVVGATGGVGGFAVELASQRGARVVATSTTLDERRVRQLGAAETIDYRVGDVATEARMRFPAGLHGVIDLVSDAKEFSAFAELVALGGRAVSTRGAAAGIPNGIDVRASPRPAVLERVARLADAGHLRAPIANVYSLEDAGGALEEFAAGAHGKISLLLANG